MSITRDQVLDLVLAAVPGEVDLFDPDDVIPYVEAGSVAHHVVELVHAGRIAELAPFLAVVERLHVEGDDYVRELATIGYLEGLQNHAGHAGLDPEVFAPLLGPESLRWWRGLDVFWSGGSPGGVLPADGPPDGRRGRRGRHRRWWGAR